MVTCIGTHFRRKGKLDPMTFEQLNIFICGCFEIDRLTGNFATGRNALIDVRLQER